MSPSVFVSARTDTLLTSSFFLLVAAVFATLLGGGLPRGCPLGPAAAAGYLVACCLALMPTIMLIKRTSGWLGGLASRHLLASQPLRKMRNRVKFEDQCWQLVIHSSMTALEVYILFVDGGGEDWLHSFRAIWSEHPDVQVHSKSSVHLLYLMQMGIWIVTALSHRFVEERHKDYVLMFSHHIVTIMLVWLSYTYGFLRIGTAVLFLHDSSDIVGDLLKCANYLQLEGASHFFLTEICFITNLFTWAYARLYVFAFQIVWRSAIFAPRFLFTAPGYPGMEPEDKLGLDRGHRTDENDFDILTNLKVMPRHPNLSCYWAPCILLTVLVWMHAMWYFLFWRILIKLIRGTNSHKVGEEEYEGASDDEK